MTSLLCPSCTVTVTDAQKPGETLFQAKARLRVELAGKCPRAGTQVKCPMGAPTAHRDGLNR